MLFVAFLAVTIWGTRRAQWIGLPPERFQDFVVWLFVSGLIGARIVYMVQYAHQFPDRSLLGLLAAFVKIWEGGIVLYGSVLGGVFGYGLFYWWVLRRLRVSGWQLADVVAPLIALGVAIGRLGCWLNGCCWGQVACTATSMVPLGAAHFPLLPAYARAELVAERGLQSPTGFTITPVSRREIYADPRSVVQAVEEGSAAAQAGIQPGDRIVQVNGHPNAIVVDSLGGSEVRQQLQGLLADAGAVPVRLPSGREVIGFEKLEDYLAFQRRVAQAGLLPYVYVDDLFNEMVRDWPRGHNRLQLTVLRGEEVLELPPFVPRTVGLYNTQLYETVSMLLLIPVLLLYYPYRRHDGQLLVILMVAYAVHRFINESLRIEPSYTFGLTLSQWGSGLIVVAAVAIETYLRLVVPSRRQVPLSSAGPAASPGPPPTPGTPGTGSPGPATAP